MINDLGFGALRARLAVVTGIRRRTWPFSPDACRYQQSQTCRHRTTEMELRTFHTTEPHQPRGRDRKI